MYSKDFEYPECFHSSECSQLTQKSVVGLRPEKLLNPVKVKAERKENLDVGSLSQNLLVGLLGVLQVRHADGVASLLIANSIEWIHHLERVSNRKAN